MHDNMFFVEEIDKFELCGKTGYLIGGSEYKKPYPVDPQKEWEHNFSVCQGCKNNQKKLAKSLIKRLSTFPNCCDLHKKLFNVSWFKKADFESVPEQCANKIFYSWFHIIHYVDNPLWEKEIFDYLEHVINSFGSFPRGYGNALFLPDYFKGLKDLLTKPITSDIISKKELEVRVGKIREYLDMHFVTDDEKRKSDFNVLISTYNKWYKIFPFQLSFFAHLKDFFGNQIPILSTRSEINKYSGVAKAKMHTKDSLIDALLNLTNNILIQINTNTLYEKGLLTEPQKIKIELILNERRMKLKQGYINKSPNEEQRYRKILKEWFADEKKFIDEVTPLVKELPPQPINSETFTEKYTAKHYLLAYLFECNAKGESYPIGNKKELERIGNERMGAGKGNRFYKVFNEIINTDLNVETNLFEIGGEYWRKAVIELSKAPELVEKYLQSKQL